MTDDIVVRGSDAKTMPRGPSDDDPEVGKWYWVKDKRWNGKKGEDEEYRWLGCVTHVGTNYVMITSVHGGKERVHFDDFWGRCEFEPEAMQIIRNNAESCRERIGELTEEMQLLTTRLGVAPTLSLSGGADTEALACRDSEPMPDYKDALIKAKEDQIPDLFEEIRKTTENMTMWLKAETIPLGMQRDQMNEMIDRVDRRVLAVDLYAGLSEDTEKIRDGKPAELAEPVRLLQRRHYMDEECLAHYKTGGMEFNNIGDFDKWLVDDENRERVLPFPRCVVAFRVRRAKKGREVYSIQEFINLDELQRLDFSTFLYVRNGEQVWRVNTKIDFQEKLFPDSDRLLISSGQKMWAKMSGSRVEGFVSDNEHTAILEKYECDMREWKKLDAQWDAASEKDREEHNVPWPGLRPYWRNEYYPFDPSNVYYDDMVKEMEEQIEDHNRVVMVLQGILDRSEVLHPHPPWKLWTDAGFRAGVRLVFDKDRALVAGEKPDFEDYRQRLNASLKVGSITIGQELAWMKKEAEKENERRANDWRLRGGYRELTTYSPYGNPGPGELAAVVKFMPRARKATFHWHRERQSYGYDHWGKERSNLIHASFTCHESDLLNVSAYTPGDFKQFFDDPRTRADYLEWAPLLLMAEEYYAGNLKIEEGECNE